MPDHTPASKSRLSPEVKRPIRSDPHQEPSQSPGGRPRDPAIDQAILSAGLTLLDEVGYSGLTLEAIARRASTTKPTIYRRWAGLPELLLDALTARLGELEVPDTECTICDLSDAIKLHVGAFRRMPPDALASLLADCHNDPKRREAFMAALFDPPRRSVGQALDRAIARGDLRGDVDRDLLLDLLASLVHYRALFGHASTSDAEVARAVHALLRGVAVDYPHLIAVSKKKVGDPTLHSRHGVAP
ncbi:TetR/AcrR family transcriptional regulator [Arthrobacter glacialis]|uniref:TetR family transcriptional regulator n=1 Tax=Arthrobacter glacialis TaxID=1664 RepID=A0A2S3ZR87_ARTGL|nr:TetR/AcrR family transcriptional regulator [Arthrobacter glacialis]POH71746.1 TetR family transcriptional regulator [Arthrobacter glacialis]